MFHTTLVTVAYLITLKLGVLGNCWVISSVIRSRRPRSGSLSPSDRLRTYIGLLAVVDLLVIVSLVIRLTFVLLPDASVNTHTCRVIFIIDHLVKLASITCLTCISVERYITIRKPFSSRVRKRFIQLTPLFAFLLLAVMLVGIASMAWRVVADARRRNCVQADLIDAALGADGVASRMAHASRWIVAVGFVVQLSAVTVSYSQIVRHVRRKFSQRKARVVANATTTMVARKQPLLVSEPRYMRGMTAAIVRVAVFHAICWLPYCLVQMLPDVIRLIGDNSTDGTPFAEYVVTSLRFLPSGSDAASPQLLAWLAFVADWLTYVNSAGDWVFYAAMNRDLRSIIRATTERRKRSTMSQTSPSSQLHRSLRRQMTQSLRFFYSINSYRSTGNSFDESVSTVQNAPPGAAGGGSLCGCKNGARLLMNSNAADSQSPNGSLSPPGYHKMSADSTSTSNGGGSGVGGGCSGGGCSGEGLFGMRNGRAYTYCSPRPVHFSSHVTSSNGQSHLLSNGSSEGGVLTANSVLCGNRQIFFPNGSPTGNQYGGNIIRGSTAPPYSGNALNNSNVLRNFIRYASSPTSTGGRPSAVVLSAAGGKRSHQNHYKAHHPTKQPLLDRCNGSGGPTEDECFAVEQRPLHPHGSVATAAAAAINSIFLMAPIHRKLASLSSAVAGAQLQKRGH